MTITELAQEYENEFPGKPLDIEWTRDVYRETYDDKAGKVCYDDFLDDLIDELDYIRYEGRK